MVTKDSKKAITFINIVPKTDIIKPRYKTSLFAKLAIVSPTIVVANENVTIIPAKIPSIEINC